jgi:fucose permease
MKNTRMGLVLLLAYVGFISLGLPDSVIGVAWPSIRRSFGLPLDALGPYFLAGATGYFLSSFNSGKIVTRWGVGLVLAFSSLLTALSLLGYALAPAWIVIVGLSFVGGFGAGAIDSGINTFAAVRFTNRHVNWLHACWGIGAATGPAIMTGVLGIGASWRWGYVVVMGVLLVLTLGFFMTLHLWRIDGGQEPKAEPHARRRTSLTLPAAWLSMGVFYVYCGIEASAGQWSYSLLVESRGISPVTAGLWVSLYWGALTAGRILIGAISNHVPPVRMLRICMLGVLAGVIVLSLRVGHGLEAVGLGLTGFSLAVIFPTMISQTPTRFESAHVPNVVGFQVASASIGIATIPWLIGVVARHAGLEVLPGLLLAATVVMIVLHELVVRRTSSADTDS